MCGRLPYEERDGVLWGQRSYCMLQNYVIEAMLIFFEISFQFVTFVLFIGSSIRAIQMTSVEKEDSVREIKLNEILMDLTMSFHDFRGKKLSELLSLQHTFSYF